MARVDVWWALGEDSTAAPTETGSWELNDLQSLPNGHMSDPAQVLANHEARINGPTNCGKRETLKVLQIAIDDDKSRLFSHDQRLAQGEEAMMAIYLKLNLQIAITK